MSTITRCPCNFAFSRINHMIVFSPTLSALSWSVPASRPFDYQVTRYRHFRTVSARIPHFTDDFTVAPALTPRIPRPFRHISPSAYVFPPTVKHFPCHYQRFFDSTTHLPEKLQFITHFPRSRNNRYWDNVSSASLWPAMLVLIRRITWSQVRRSEQVW